jgi:hypothetical protein
MCALIKYSIRNKRSRPRDKGLICFSDLSAWRNAIYRVPHTFDSLISVVSVGDWRESPGNLLGSGNFLFFVSFPVQDLKFKKFRVSMDGLCCDRNVGCSMNRNEMLVPFSMTSEVLKQCWFSFFWKELCLKLFAQTGFLTHLIPW